MPLYDLTHKRVLILGASGLAGTALHQRLSMENCTLLTPSHRELDLKAGNAVDEWFAHHKPQAVFMAAARVGGIMANMTYPAEFIFDNLAMALNVTAACHRHDIEKYLFIGSSCIYPKDTPQPMKEDDLLKGPLESSNEAYAIAKLAGIKLAQSYRQQYGRDFISVLPCNLYGTCDKFHDLENSHVIPALINKIHAAKMNKAPHVTLWGSGTPLREFLFADDLADALVFVMKHYSDAAPINIGTGKDISIKGLADKLKVIVKYEGDIVFDPAKPDGVPRKVLDTTRLSQLGWAASTSLADGLKQTYEAFLNAPLA